MAYEFDLLTIGAGSGGVAGSRRAAAYGPRVGIIEEARIGGTCVLRGCVPKKLLIYGVDIADTLADAAGFGWSIDGASLDWRKLIAAKDAELDRLHGIYVSMLDKAGVARIEGRGVLVDPHTVQVGDRRVTAERILIATGGWPTVPDIPGKELMITSNEALDLKNLPERIVIYGAGYIAVEFAGIFRAAGCTVDLVFRGDQVLRGFDGEVRAHLTDALAARGINLLPGRTIASVAEEGAARRVTLSDGSVILAGQVMAATGRAPNTKGLGLEAVGVQTGAQGEIIVDNWSRTSVPSIYAVGDVTNRFNLTPVAIAEARAVAETLYNHNPMSVFENIVPTAVFSRPEVGTVGLSEEAALAAGHTLDIYTTRFRPMKNTISGRAERTFMKLVVDQPSQRVLGAHMVGPDAAEIVQGIAVALTCGATKQQFDRTIGLHPSAAEEFVTLRDKRT
ncbi:glutathione-disulfide reductase [Elstera cyanobacteriorum]|uniref:glutathione-disulfide reductase n=1 Tax=Elstera cyanobacteriorum TaxID=2022747 RepID=UPI002353123E|nr:glutathione-disulfide reductase [Elstera cyanobacteriorum]MCK6443623.1 glutathione-disulfide reductase [Elstera cyanobacteriorum]